ncbi:MAG: lytic transglycosylase domain-containing protein, partial [Candidatus Acidiferrales bacterium]
MRFWSKLAILLPVVVLLGTQATRAQITAQVAPDGRRMYSNLFEDSELRSAIHEGGAAAVQRVIERRRRSLPGIEESIDEIAREHSVDPRLVRAVIETESAWDPRARSRKGALGLMQLMPQTAVRFRVRDPYDPTDNIEGGVRYLRFLLDRFHQNVRLALAAYNAGEEIVTSRGKVPRYRETRAYVQQVTTLY